MGSYYKQQLNDWVSTLDVKANILFDIGGAQNPLKGRTRSWEVEDYKIVDLATPHVTLQAQDLKQDFNKHLDTAEFQGYLGMVDSIYCLGVFDYVINPNIALNNIYKLLTKGGRAWVEFPFVYPRHNPKELDGLRFTESSIENLAKQEKLTCVDRWYRRPKPDNPYLLNFYSYDGMRAADGVDHNITGFIFEFEK